MLVISLQAKDTFTAYNPMAFVASWSDETYRYHVWIGLRPDVDGERPPYPVRIGETIYKNPIEGHSHNTRQLDINAKANAKIKAEIKRRAQYETLLAMHNNLKAGHKVFDDMRAEADRLNAIFNAWRLLETATVDEKMALNLI